MREKGAQVSFFIITGKETGYTRLFPLVTGDLRCQPFLTEELITEVQIRWSNAEFLQNWISSNCEFGYFPFHVQIKEWCSISV